MELVINISKWPESSPLEHVSTDIIIKDSDDNTILADTITTLVYVKEIDIPVGSTYYVTEKRAFKVKGVENGNDELTYESVVHTITNDDEAISNMLLSKPVIVEKPVVLLKSSDIINSETDVLIKSSSFRGSGDGHTHTHWVVVVDGDIVLREFNDTINKTSIMVAKSLLENYTSSIEVYCTHCSNFIESETEVFRLTKNSLNFKVISNLTNIPIGSYNLKISKIDINKEMRLTKVLVKHNELLLKTYLVNNDNTIVDIVLGSSLIESNRTLTIELYGLGTNLELNKKVYTLVPRNLQYDDNLNKDYEYAKTITSKVEDLTFPLGLVSDTLNNQLLVPNDTTLDLYSFDPLTLVTNIPTLAHLGVKDNMYIKVNNDHSILIDCLSSSNVPTFLVYEYDTLTGVYYLKYNMPRDIETFTVAINNSIEQISNDEFIYSVKGTNKLMHYNKRTNVLTTLKDIPLEGITDSTIIKMDDNQLLIIGNNSYYTTIYNIEGNRYIDGLVMTFSDYVNESSKKVDLVNGDKLLLINKDTTNSSKVLYFDISKYEFEELDIVISKTNNNILYKNNNTNIIADVIPANYINVLVDKLNIVEFI